MDEDTLQFENTLQPQQIPNRENSGQGFYRLEPTFTGKTYDDVKKEDTIPYGRKETRDRK